MRAQESKLFQGLSGTQNGTEFELGGGIYQIGAIATWGGGSAELFTVGPDGSTWLSVSDLITANGGDTIYLSPGRYRWSIITATGVSLTVVRVPTE